MANKKRASAKKPVLIGVGALVLASTGTVSAVATRYEPLIAPGTEIAGLSVGGLSPVVAKKKIADWWKTAVDQPLTFTSKTLDTTPKGLTPKTLGATLDTEATVAKLPKEDFWANSARKLGMSQAAGRTVSPIIVFDKAAEATVAEFVREHAPELQTARADLVNGKIVRTPEQAGLELDRAALPEALTQATLTGASVEIPLARAKTKVTEEDLARIKEVVSTFTSRYSEGNANRASNIRNAAKRLSGTVLLPGETFSFNKVLGQRTAANGFKMAGVYRNGKHDFDIGGGICQVSGTLYNSVLLANLKIVNRSNHTYPVPYLPVGRDATVSFPEPDFSFQNNTDGPISISSVAGGGSITFKVLGTKDPDLKVSLETAGHRSWSRGEKTIVDSSLPPGGRKVEEPGGNGHSIMTYRIVQRKGQPAERQSLGESYYNGGPRIVRYNPAAAAPKAPVAPTTDLPPKPTDDESPNADGFTHDKPADAPKKPATKAPKKTKKPATPPPAADPAGGG